ncbi:hypothetical protein [Enterococcus faecium]|uniref:hypothetical protein n=1 Tax=Enterococcus faecium TaxID=1352 RepID=UPI0004258A27|nr:hypothetical protein [Enterococcus faecium]KEI53477.1 hypothetical protein P743_0106370 [Enterococcus faecium UC8733]
MTIIDMIIFIFLALVLTGVAVFLTISAFLGSYARSWRVIKSETKLCFSKKEQAERIEFSYNYTNDLFKDYLNEIVSTKQVDIMSEYNLKKDSANNIQVKAKTLIKNADYEFVKQEDVVEILKRNKSFKLTNAYMNAIKTFSNPKYSKLLDFTINNDNPDINDLKELEMIIREIYGFKINTNNNKNIRLLQLIINNHEKTKNSNRKNNAVANSYLSAVMPKIFNKDQMMNYLIKGTNAQHYKVAKVT